MKILKTNFFEIWQLNSNPPKQRQHVKLNVRQGKPKNKLWVKMAPTIPLINSSQALVFLFSLVLLFAFAFWFCIDLLNMVDRTKDAYL